MRPRWTLAALVIATAIDARADNLWSESNDQARLRANLSLGVMYRQVLAYGDQLDYVTRSGAKLPFDASAFGPMQEVALDFGVRVYFVGPTYLGLESFLGGIGVGGAVDESSRLFVSGGVRFFGGAGGVLGVRLFRRGVVQIGAELFAGAQIATFFLYHVTGGPYFTGHREILAEGIIEPRARIDLWLSRTLTLGLWAGTNFLEPGEPELGAALVVHLAKKAR
jgi:hypothetical protein